MVVFAGIFSKNVWLLTNTENSFFTSVFIPPRKHSVATDLVSVNVKQTAPNLLPLSLCCLCSSSHFQTVEIEFFTAAFARPRENERES